MDAFLVSTFIVALAEIGDKTQLLAIVLASRFKQPGPIIAGIFAATLINHALAASAGYFISGLFASAWFRILVALAFMGMAVWALIPDKEDDRHGARAGGVFITTLIAFFLVEIGDKTQVATVALAARFHDIARVAAGTTLGMLIANVPAVTFGEAATRIVPLRIVRIIAAFVFFGLGLWALIEALKPPS